MHEIIYLIKKRLERASQVSLKVVEQVGRRPAEGLV